MKSMIKRPTEQAQSWIRKAVSEGDCVIDATVGNGHDTLFLARCVGDRGKVIGFDVQQVAIDATRKLLLENQINAGIVDFHCCSHALLADHVQTPIAAAMFNLGYLPGADHTLITEKDETIIAMKAAALLLHPGGLITAVCYPGHPGGDEEMVGVIEWATGLDGNWQVVKYEKIGTLKKAPVLLGIQKFGIQKFGIQKKGSPP
jgi:SAM-dependent methyltransferase